MTPDFSIITCTRNSATTLRQTLQSIQQQRGASFEQVFVDGDSTDATLNLLRAVPGQTTLLTGVRGGIAKAMNMGINAARGEIVAHLHSDDSRAARFVDGHRGWSIPMTKRSDEREDRQSAIGQ